MATPASFESTLLTAEDLEHIRLPDKRTELVQGRLLGSFGWSTRNVPKPKYTVRTGA